MSTAHPAQSADDGQQHDASRLEREDAAPEARRPFADLDPERFKAAFRNHPAGVSLVTADAGDGPVALTASSVFSVSLEPPLLVFSLSQQSSSAPTIGKADTLVVHLLDADHVRLARLGATSGIDRFADADAWTRLPTGEPIFRGVTNWIRGRIVNRLDAGGSTVVVVHALESGDARDESATPLVYHRRTWHRLDDGTRLPDAD